LNYCFDIDDTLLKYHGDYKLATPITERINRVNQLYDEGHKIILMTARGMSSGNDYSDLTKMQLLAFGIKYHELVMNKKPNADIFIDDKGLNVSDWDKQSNSVIWLNGCFDILHRGHIELFKYASSMGCRVVVGLDSDERIKIAKGKNRPINVLNDRIEILSSLKWIHEVVSFNSDEELCTWLKYYRPKYRVLGGDYKECQNKIVGVEHSGQIIFFDRVEQYSTSGIINVL
jgi:D-beta-D-heptose 7-phosphate kinase/D-beta-D-heptose 1-phosphate adenosyltransferase